MPGKSLGPDRQFLQICAARNRSALPITETELRYTGQIWRESVQLPRNGRVGIQPPTCAKSSVKTGQCSTLAHAWPPDSALQQLAFYVRLRNEAVKPRVPNQPRWLRCWPRGSDPQSGTHRGLTHALRIGPVTSRAAPLRARHRRWSIATQHLTHAAVPYLEAGNLGYSKGPRAVASGRQAIDREVEAGQPKQRVGDDHGPLSAGGGIGGGHSTNKTREE